MPILSSAVLLTVWEEAASQPTLRRALTLLATVWPDRSVNEWAGVSIGERDGRLLRLREDLFGAALEATVQCPGCTERLELSFSTQDILLPAAAGPASGESLRLHVAGYDIIYRVPTSMDLLEIAQTAAADERQILLMRCIRAAPPGGAVVDPAELPDDVVAAVIEHMARADPQADVQIALTCPACEHQWSMPFDILSYLWGEIEEWAQRLLLDVHALASVYGWSERDIVSMSPQRRQLYLDMVGA